MNMKLLLISVMSNISKGGIATWTSRFLSRCDAHDIECHLVNTEMVGKRKEKATSNISLCDEFVRTKRIFSDLRGCFNSEHHFDLAHLNTSCGKFGLFRDYIIAKRIKSKGVRLVTHFHCDIPNWINNKLSYKVLRKLVKISDVNLVLCENSRRYLEKNFCVTSYKIPNFLNEEMIISYDRSHKEKVETAFFVGRVEPAKGAKEIFELAKRLPNIEFLLAGEVNQSVIGWDKPNNITFVGKISHQEVLREMDNADVFIFPSHSEGFSLALTEAMARGLPIIATDVGAAEDMLAENCGIIVPVGDTEKMVEAFVTMSSRDVRIAFSKNSINKVKNQYTTDVIILAMKKLYFLS